MKGYRRGPFKGAFYCTVFATRSGRVRHWHWPRREIVGCDRAKLIA